LKDFASKNEFFGYESLKNKASGVTEFKRNEIQDVFE
jgi:hypothetical protein